mmetsp:Transcript_23803/g.54251  ORF Transcript_23803/g.54251 Transcript_23803/m.54251 type:complete len:286 (+) Transcript_23803:544-1401(+)
MIRRNRRLTLLHQLILKLSPLAIVVQHAFDQLRRLPLIVPISLAILHAISPRAVVPGGARADQLDVRRLGVLPAPLVLRALIVTVPSQCQPSFIHLTAHLIGLLDFCVDGFLQVAALGHLRLSSSRKFLALVPHGLVLCVLPLEISLQRRHHPLHRSEALLPTAGLVVTAHKARVQLDVFTGSVPRGVGANGELLAAHSVVVLYQNVPVVEAFAVLALQVLHAACAASPLTLHNVERGLRVLHLPGGEPFVSGVALEDLTVNCHDEQLISGMALQNSGLDDVVDH